MLHELFAGLSAYPSPVAAKLKMLDVDYNAQAEALQSSPRLIPQQFNPGDLVTQWVTGVDPRDGEPLTGYLLPLPGTPARVEYMIPPPHAYPTEADAVGPVDMVILVPGPDGVLHRYAVCSAYFCYWRNGDQLAPKVREYLENNKPVRTRDNQDA